MPATFEDFGFRFLYPDNWTLQSRQSDTQTQGVTLDLPGGGFFSVTRYPGDEEPEAVLTRIAGAMKQEYPEIEIDAIQVSDEDDFFIESRFYYLDLLVISRVTAIETPQDGLIIIESQAESREFDAAQPVFAAVIESLRQSL